LLLLLLLLLLLIPLLQDCLAHRQAAPPAVQPCEDARVSF
jgi:hypothetical protein